MTTQRHPRCSLHPMGSSSPGMMSGKKRNILILKHCLAFNLKASNLHSSSELWLGASAKSYDPQCLWHCEICLPGIIFSYTLVQIENCVNHQVTEETNFIVFHMNGINITSKKINEKLKIQRILELPERDQVYLETDNSMTPGTSFSVRLKFEYQLSKSLEGFYLSTYKDQDGKEK